MVTQSKELSMNGSFRASPAIQGMGSAGLGVLCRA